MTVRRGDVLAVIAGAVGGTLLAIALGRSPLAVLASAVAVALLGLAASVDLRERRVPNALTYGGTLAALGAAAIAGHAVMAIAGCLFATTLMAVMYVLARGRLGMGDVKLAAAVGATIGPAAVPMFLLASGVAGAVGALLLLAYGRSRHDTMPYAPAMVAGAILALAQAGTLVG